MPQRNAFFQSRRAVGNRQDVLQRESIQMQQKIAQGVVQNASQAAASGKNTAAVGAETFDQHEVRFNPPYYRAQVDVLRGVRQWRCADTRRPSACAKVAAMYLPPQFNSHNRAVALELMRAHPLASLISNDDEELPFVSHLPLHAGLRGDELVLLGHCAKPNPHWRYLQARPCAVVTFLGPHAYLSPKVYPDLVRVPTWNYLAVHCTVQATLVEDEVAKDRLLKQLISDHDPDYAAQWMALAPEYQHRMLAGIVGFELRVTALQCKLKLNQHRPEAHAGMRAGYAAGGENERALGQWMDKLGIGDVVPGRT
jgi:transcriptional regulator